MPSARYLPDATGPIAAAGDRAWMLAAAAFDPDALFAAVRAAEPARAVVTMLSMQGWDALPDFVLVELIRGDRVRIVRRGAIELVVDDEPSTTAAGVATWTETTQQASRVVIGDVAGGSLPIGIGVVHASGIEVVLAANPATPSPPDASLVAAEPEPHREPVVETAAEFDDHTVAPEQTVLPDATVDLAAMRTPQPTTDGADSYDYLFGSTVLRPVQDAAAEDPEIVTAPQQSGDHDGETVLSSSVRQLREAAVAAAPTHYLELSTGGRAELDGPVIVGRSPSGAATGGQVPQLIAIPGKDISRNHVRFTVEGDSVVVTDLNSRNGTVVIAPGHAPQQLRRGEPTVVLPLTVVDLGGGITVQVKEHPGGAR